MWNVKLGLSSNGKRGGLNWDYLEWSSENITLLILKWMVVCYDIMHPIKKGRAGSLLFGFDTGGQFLLDQLHLLVRVLPSLPTFHTALVVLRVPAFSLALPILFLLLLLDDLILVPRIIRILRILPRLV